MTKQKSLANIEAELKQLPAESLPQALQKLEQDSRKGAQILVQKAKKKLEKIKKEKERLKKLWTYEEKYYSENQGLIAGIDEAGRGPLAGPVVAAAVILPPQIYIPHLNDSKKLSYDTREQLYNIIQKEALGIGIGIIDPETIDQINILQATIKAMIEAVDQLRIEPSILFIDALSLPEVPLQQEKIIQGDQKSASIAAASIIAKVTRDHLMEQWDELYPKYGFKQNKGYGTKQHIEAIHTYGLSPIHRRTFQIPKKS